MCIRDRWPCEPSQLQKCDLVGPISHRSITFRAKSVTEVWPSGPIPLQKYHLHVTFRAQWALYVWSSGPNQLHTCDLQDPISCICMTSRAQSAAYVWPSGPNQLHMYDLQGPISLYVWPSGPNQLYMYDLQDPMSCRGIATTAWLPWLCLLTA